LKPLIIKKTNLFLPTTIITVIVVFTVLNSYVPIGNNDETGNIRLGLSYVNHDPILIDGNSDFTITASNEGWNGSGTKTDPIIISGYSFSSTNSSERLINIVNTDLYFKIEDCIFQGGYYGVLLDNVSNGQIIQNTFSGTTDLYEPISVQYSINIFIINNTISDRQNAIKLKYCNSTVIDNNNFDNIDQYAIYSFRTNNSLFSNNDINDTRSGGIITTISKNNTIKNNFIRNWDAVEGITISSSTNCSVENNDISGEHIGLKGIHLLYSSNCSILNNLLINNEDYGIYLESSEVILIQNNTAHDNVQSQIYLESTDHSIIVNNSIYNNSASSDGIILTGGSSDNFLIKNIVRNIDNRPIFIENANNNTIDSNTVYDSYYGIYTSVASQLEIRNNTLFNLDNYALYVSHMKNSSIFNNSFLGRPIYLTYIESTIIDDNIISPPVSASAINILHSLDSSISHNELFGGIDLRYNCTTIIINANIIDNSNFGIRIQYYSSYVTDTITIQSNTISNSEGNGIDIDYSNNNLIINNTLLNNSEGIHLESYSEYNQIMNNSITQSRGNGIYLGFHCNNNELKSNNISSNLLFGLKADTAGNNKITWNNFLSNNQGNVSQVLDDYSYLYGINFFDFNYWDTWTTPDTNNDGIVDNPYHILGTSESTDYHPLAKPMRPEHFLTDPQLIFPNTGEVIAGNVTINWSAAIDSLNHNVSYDLMYQSVNTTSWTFLVGNIMTTNYTFNSLILPDGLYNLKVIAHCSDNLTSFDQSDVPFEIRNHILTQPTILNPSQDEIISGIYLINWQQSFDTLNHSVSYSLLYSDDQSNWLSITEGWNTTTYLWNTTSVANGNYWLKVIAVCSEGLSNSSVISFVIENIAHNLTSPEIISQTYTDDVVTIEWSNSIDSLNHTIVYSVFYFEEDKNESLILIIANTTSTSVVWNTSGVSSGTYYIVIVAICSEGLIAATTSDPIEITTNTTTTTTQISTTSETNQTSTSTTPTTFVPTNISKSSGWGLLISLLSLLLVISRKKKG